VCVEYHNPAAQKKNEKKKSAIFFFLKSYTYQSHTQFGVEAGDAVCVKLDRKGGVVVAVDGDW